MTVASWRWLTLGLSMSLALSVLLPARSAAAENDYGVPDQEASAPAKLDGPHDAFLRPYYNGAGPTAIFRFGRDDAKKRDVFAIVDPATWRIQFLALDDWTNSATDKPLSERITWGGACRLSPTERFWRVHQWPGKVVLQLQPEPTPTTIQNAKLDLRFPKITLDASPAAIAKVMARPRPSLDAAPPTPCGDMVNGAHKLFQAADASAEISAQNARAMSVRRLTPVPTSAPSAERSFWSSAQAVFWKGRRVVAAQEMEEARSVTSNAPLRHILVTARSPDTPGLARTDLVLMRRSTNPALSKRMVLRIGLARVKAGQRMVAVSSVGEVLVIGAADKTNFHIRSCYFTGANQNQPACVVQSEPTDVTATEAPADPNGPVIAAIGDRDAIWARANAYFTQTYDVNADGLPESCRRLARCQVAGKYWSPLMDLRLATGLVKARRGAPYAQMKASGGKVAQAGGAADFPLVPTFQAFERRPSQLRVFGDIENTSLLEDDPAAVVFGIDCSTFVSRLWGLSDGYSTETFIKTANKGGMTRVAEMGSIAMNDALVIRLEGKLNHIVLYREARDAGPRDASQAVMVLEASSACGGTCISLYDESFFDGWAVIRPGKAPPSQGAAMPPLTLDYNVWKGLMGL